MDIANKCISNIPRFAYYDESLKLFQLLMILFLSISKTHIIKRSNLKYANKIPPSGNKRIVQKPKEK
jgi:hypothetical protein